MRLQLQFKWIFGTSSKPLVLTRSVSMNQEGLDSLLYGPCFFLLWNDNSTNHVQIACYCGSWSSGRNVFVLTFIQYLEFWNVLVDNPDERTWQ